VPWLTQSVSQLAPTNENELRLRAGFYERQVRFRKGWNSCHGVKQLPASTDLREGAHPAISYRHQPDKAEGSACTGAAEAQVLAYPGNWRSSTHARKSSTRRKQVLEEAVRALPKDGDAKLILVVSSAPSARGSRARRSCAALSRKSRRNTTRFGLGDLLQTCGCGQGGGRDIRRGDPPRWHRSEGSHRSRSHLPRSTWYRVGDIRHSSGSMRSANPTTRRTVGQSARV